jgi:hypothetical protein
MTWLADAALWVAVALAGLSAGILASSPRQGRRSGLLEAALLGAAAAVVASLCARAGQVLGGSPSHPWVAAWVPIDAGPLARMAVLWATLPGATLTAATILLVWLALTPQSRWAVSGTRPALIVALSSLCLLGVAAWFAPGPGLAAAIPPFAQDPYAAFAPLLGLVGVVVLGWAISSAGGTGCRSEIHVAWLFATGAIACEQVARSRLGIGPRDAVLLGSASSGLVLWMLTSALVHDRLRRRLFGDRTVVRARLAGILAHVGAVCVIGSFALHAFAARSNAVLPPGQAVEVTDGFRRSWRLVNQGVSRFDEAGVEVTSLAVEVQQPGGETALLTPEIREYHGLDGQHLANGIVRRRSTGGPIQAMRIVFTEADSLDAASVRVTFLPAPILWPVGVAMLLLAGFIGLPARETPNSKNFIP